MIFWTDVEFSQIIQYNDISKLFEFRRSKILGANDPISHIHFILWFFFKLINLHETNHCIRSHKANSFSYLLTDSPPRFEIPRRCSPVGRRAENNIYSMFIIFILADWLQNLMPVCFRGVIIRGNFVHGYSKFEIVIGEIMAVEGSC